MIAARAFRIPHNTRVMQRVETTFAGRKHVPAGETFSRNPLIGPQIAYNPSNP